MRPFPDLVVPRLPATVDERIALLRKFRVLPWLPRLAALVTSFETCRLPHLKAVLERQIMRESEDVLLLHLRECPVPVAPPDVLAGPLRLGTSMPDGQVRGLDVLDLPKGLICFGPPGVGKTNCLRLVVAGALAASPTTRLLVLDAKPDFRDFFLDDGLVFSRATAFNVLQVPRGTDARTFDHVLATTLAETAWFGQHREAILLDLLERARARHPQPSIDDLLALVRADLRQPRQSFSLLEQRRAVESVLNNIARMFARAAGCRVSATWETLLDHSIYFDATVATTPVLFFHRLAAQVIFHRNIREQRRDGLTHLLLLDEFYLLGARQQQRLTQQPYAIELVTRGREFSIATLLSSVNVGDLHPAIRSAVGTQLFFGAASGDELQEAKNTLGLDGGMGNMLRELRPGMAIARVLGYPDPILLTIDRFERSKEVSVAAWAAAEARINCLPIDEPSPLVVGPTEAPERQPEPRAAQSEEEPREASKSATETSEPRLGPDEVVLGTHLCRVGISLTRAAYDGAGLGYRAGDQAVETLTTLGGLRSTRIRTGKGRGRSGVALEPLPRLFQLLKMARPGRRGGTGAQHYWLQVVLAGLLPGSELEFSLNGKAIDLAFVVNPDDDRVARLATFSDRFAACCATLRKGQAVGVEIELDPTATLASNCTKNICTGGVTLTIAAVLPEGISAAAHVIEALDPQLRERVLLVDVFDLITHLRT